MYSISKVSKNQILTNATYIWQGLLLQTWFYNVSKKQNVIQNGSALSAIDDVMNQSDIDELAFVFAFWYRWFK